MRLLYGDHTDIGTITSSAETRVDRLGEVIKRASAECVVPDLTNVCSESDLGRIGRARALFECLNQSGIVYSCDETASLLTVNKKHK